MSRDTRFSSTTVPSQNGGPCSASAAPRMTPMNNSSAARAVSSSLSSQLSLSLAAQRRVERLVHAEVVALHHTVFAMIAAKLRQKGDGLLGPLVDELTEQPRQGLAEHRELAAEIGREKVTHRQVDGEPLGIEVADQVLRRRGVGRPRRAASAARRGRRVPRRLSVGISRATAHPCRYGPRQSRSTRLPRSPIRPVRRSPSWPPSRRRTPSSATAWHWRPAATTDRGHPIRWAVSSGALVSPDNGLPSNSASRAPTASPARPNSEPRPSIDSPEASAPRARPPATPQKFASIEPSTNRSSAAMVAPASPANTTAAANRVHTSRRSTSTSATAGSRPASVMGSADAASPAPRGSSAVGGATSSVRSCDAGVLGDARCRPGSAAARRSGWRRSRSAGCGRPDQTRCRRRRRDCGWRRAAPPRRGSR